MTARSRSRRASKHLASLVGAPDNTSAARPLTCELKGLYISKLPELTIYDDFLVTIQNQVVPVHAVAVCKSDDKVLEIDIETAWEEMGLHPGWSNEVELTVTFAIDHEQIEE